MYVNRFPVHVCELSLGLCTYVNKRVYVGVSMNTCTCNNVGSIKTQASLSFIFQISVCVCVCVYVCVCVLRVSLVMYI